MAIHQYMCPECGVALQSTQDVAGRAVRCLGCQAVFTARSGRAPAAKPIQKSALRERDDDYRPELPPIPRERKLPAALFVIGGAAAIAVAATIFLVVRYKARKADPIAATTVAKNETPARPETGTPQATAKPADNSKPVEDPPSIPRREEEEDTTPAKTSVTPKGPPDLTNILPKFPGLTPKDPPVADPKPPAPKADAPIAAKPPEPKPADQPDAPTRADGLIPAALLGKLKAATVFIKVDAGAMQGSGSGFVLRVEGNNALVVTNNHVISPSAKFGPIGDVRYELVFHSGRKNEFSLKGEVVGADKERDLAILHVSGVLGVTGGFPEALNTTDKAPLAETMPIYIFGFPFGEMLATSKANPAVTVGKGSISSLREDDGGDTSVIQIDGDVNPGNSGGPVVDARGRLVGVTVAKLKGTNIGLAIPPVELARMLGGRLGNLEFRVGRQNGTNVEMDVRGTLIDPMDRVTTASILVVRADDLKDKPAVGAGGKWAPLPGAAKADLKLTGRGVSGSVQLPVRGRDRGQFEIYFQPACVDKDGKTTYFAPVSETLYESGRGPQIPPGVRPEAPGGVPAPGNPGIPGVIPGPGGPGNVPGSAIPGSPPLPPGVVPPTPPGATGPNIGPPGGGRGGFVPPRPGRPGG